ncbi:MAG: type I-E CRISPR-associated protein Cse2/CasB [Deltaproteobacteria bacterium]|nr:MAG: type I-E CRISPR-associated protein Cse2/CasB [Deltaproteobacteria bacterium]
MDEKAKRLLKFLKEHKEDRGMMADLRRGFSEATEDRAWPYVARWCDLTNDRERIIYQTVMAAYAHHPEVSEKGNMGHVLRSLAMGDGRGEDGLKTFDGRFRRLLTCNSAQEACQHLIGIIRAVAQKEIRINYICLLKDLWYWGKRVKLSWASAYWGSDLQGGEA